MDLKKLIYFVTIVEEGQITRAANRLHIAQPPLSMQLKALEEELGVILINRDKKEFELTHSGFTFYRRAKEVLDSIDGMITEVKEEQEGLRGKLSIGTVKSCVPYLLPLLNKFKEKYPDVTFQLWEEDSQRLEELLLSKKIELGIVRLPLQSQDVKDINTLSIYPLHSEPLVAIQPKDWDKFESDVITIEELKDSPLLILHSQGDIYIFHKFVETCKTHGFTPNIICESSDVSTLMKLAELGVGIAIVPKVAVHLLQQESLSYFEIVPKIKSDTALIWIENKYMSKAAHNFKELATNLV
ncbi:LysR family transcriptional regulator [Bacillus cereus]|uniref:HTH-type transcriptional regulator CzcR n=1 Tax=Bacillus cereus TaxID=1396 RepID=A0A2A8Y478_BACCE|nr:LysR family transcriptional regulator [Bacillus cereus]PFC74464.1 LysR family transcriptional regulator [Bacillus cereus]